MAGYLPHRGVFKLLTRSSEFLRAQKNGFLLRSSRSYSASYEGDGKTTVTVLNQEEGAPLMIDAYGTHGFRLNNGMTVLGPMAIFPKTVLAWNVRDIQDINITSLSLFFTLEPKLGGYFVGVPILERRFNGMEIDSGKLKQITV
ncbi:unnamed protein product [Allacma fusca]|uniref:Uncharacterized protein n=1 Tax=Allacma fusca TaxID=39272 RepID=A0A8J2K6N2_9HEXA|nr:unnamed protein product [Allacma fusca]